MSLNTSNVIYCDKSFDDFHTNYKHVHGHLSVVVCLLGTMANTLNIMVLSRREMRTPTNAILTGLAVADLAVMLEYLPYAIHDYILSEYWTREQQLNYSWACYIKFHAIYAQVLHTISIWLTVMLAVWRYIAVTYPQVSREWCGMSNTVISILLAYVICGLVVTPWLYLVSSVAQFEEVVTEQNKVLYSRPLSEYILKYQAKHDYANFSKLSTLNATGGLNISSGGGSGSSRSSGNSVSINDDNVTINDTSLFQQEQQQQQHHNITVYRLYHSDMALQNSTLRLGTLLVYSVLIKLIPCIALTVLSLRLITALLEVKRRRQMLHSQLLKAEEKSSQSNASQSMPVGVGGSGAVVGGTTVAGSSPLVDANQMAMNSTLMIRKKIDKAKQTDRTTQMLLAVLMLFLITELPQGIMGLLNTILGEAFFMQCYLKLSDLMDILALLNSSINFILYCSMSRQFRQTFILLFCPRRLGRCLLSHRKHHRRHHQNHSRHQNEKNSCHRQDKHQHHRHDSHQHMPLQEDNCTLVNGLMAHDNRSRSACTDQWFQTTQVTNV
ncbi:G-protein coupled receptor dmsr-1-like [Musca domestica]|uniref:G-protein coupled receptor dmsr-1-like n=1 Tax=Musca domestica TaxID=7370 RepID=A0ABM3VQ43_MUSDO|nr:G-protein coupled receptor dmsr-1-like [Musca domestica]